MAISHSKDDNHSGLYHTMDFDVALAQLGWTKARLARRLGVHVNTVTKWSDGCPGYVQEYLRVCLLAKEVLAGGER